MLTLKNGVIVSLFIVTPFIQKHGSLRTATVVASQSSVLYRLSLDNYDKMRQDDPELAFHLHQWIGRALSAHLAENNHRLKHY